MRIYGHGHGHGKSAHMHTYIYQATDITKMNFPFELNDHEFQPGSFYVILAGSGSAACAAVRSRGLADSSIMRMLALARAVHVVEYIVRMRMIMS